MAITTKVMAISWINIMVPNILQLFDAHELNIYIFNSHYDIKYEHTMFLMPLIGMEVLMAIIFVMAI